MSKIISRPGPRFLYPELVNSRSLGRCGLEANVLWPRLICQADDQGRMAGDAGSVFVTCCANIVHLVDVAKVEAALAELKAAGMVLIYRANGEHYLQIAQWWRWQQGMRRAYASRFPSPRGWIDIPFGFDGAAISFAKAAESGRFVLSKDYRPLAPRPQSAGRVPAASRQSAANARAQGHDPTRPDPSRPDPTRLDPSTARDVPPRSGTNGAKPHDQSIDDSIALANDATKAEGVRRAARKAVERHAPDRLGEIGAGA
ncbi:MAG TPA: hypothetical protein VEW95_05465 [Candidatus Limnocylindrales bacterium]|nr:hypothetical protein [Candidatus Limnocylindrales bacterium]